VCVVRAGQLSLVPGRSASYAPREGASLPYRSARCLRQPGPAYRRVVFASPFVARLGRGLAIGVARGRTANVVSSSVVRVSQLRLRVLDAFHLQAGLFFDVLASQGHEHQLENVPCGSDSMSPMVCAAICSFSVSRPTMYSSRVPCSIRQ
jgi:hypothetical protein